MSKSIIAVPLIIGTVLASGLVTININHHLILPGGINMQSIIRNKTFVNRHYPFIHTQYDIYLQDEIKKYNQTENVIEALDNAEKGDIVVFHLAGYGGEVEATERMINAVETTPAYVVMQVEAPVYSGHAFLASTGDKLIIQPNAYMMFHNTTAIDVDCSEQTGEDRGETNEQHCIHFINAHLQNFYKILYERITILSAAEKQEIVDGKDVYISSDEVKIRQEAEKQRQSK